MNPPTVLHVLSTEQQRVIREQVRKLMASRTARQTKVRSGVMEERAAAKLERAEWERFCDLLKEL